MSEADFRDLVRVGRIRADSLVWRTGFARWLPLAEALPDAVVPLEEDAGGCTACSGCGAVLDRPALLVLSGNYVCGSCKGAFVQKIREGVGAQFVTRRGLEYGGFWLRAVARLIDGAATGGAAYALLLGGIIAAAAVAGATADMSPWIRWTMVALGGLYMLFTLAMPIAYEVWFVARYRATPGKMVFRMEVVRGDGGPVGFWRSLGRSLAVQVNWMLGGLTFVIVGFDPEKRGLHDSMCDTRVVVKNRR